MSKTPEEVKQKLRAKGLTVQQWATGQGFNVRAVRAVLYGHNKAIMAKPTKLQLPLE